MKTLAATIAPKFRTIIVGLRSLQPKLRCSTASSEPKLWGWGVRLLKCLAYGANWPSNVHGWAVFVVVSIVSILTSLRSLADTSQGGDQAARTPTAPQRATFIIHFVELQDRNLESLNRADRIPSFPEYSEPVAEVRNLPFNQLGPGSTVAGTVEIQRFRITNQWTTMRLADFKKLVLIRRAIGTSLGYRRQDWHLDTGFTSTFKASA